MNIPHDFSCHEGSKNVYFIQVRNLEGQNHPGHTVQYQLPIRRNFEHLEKHGVFKFFKSLHLQVFRASCSNSKALDWIYVRAGKITSKEMIDTF